MLFRSVAAAQMSDDGSISVHIFVSVLYLHLQSGTDEQRADSRSEQAVPVGSAAAGAAARLRAAEK